MREEKRATARASLVGETLGDAYRVIRLMGEGAMGGIFEARQLRLDKRVAIKVLARELAVNGEALLRFHREAEITSQLGHPHIISVFDFGTTNNGQPYLVMEYLEGEDLAYKLQRKGALPLTATVRVIKQVASALAETHAKGIVHRDLKPANVFIVRVGGEDFAKVLDFGISKVRAASTALTNASTLMGTPMYMAPEQAKGEVELDHLTDQWALACITFEMLAGRPPYVGDDTAALLYQVVHQDPPRLSHFVRSLPIEVERVVHRALAKQPADRFPNVTAFARAFEAAATGKPLPTEPASDESPIGPGISLTPVEAAATLASSSAKAFAPSSRKRGPRRVALYAGVAGMLIAGVALVRGPLRRPPPAPGPVGAAEAAGATPVVPGQPAVEPLPPEPPAANAAGDDPAQNQQGGQGGQGGQDEPAAEADDTDSAQPKIKKDRARRRPARRPAAAKSAAPAPTPAVKRKLINEL
jgi:eukaryotic-like serine/threonine-protein kinase